MISYFKNTMVVQHPIVFLCGPAYSRKDESDRRNIMLKFFDERFDRRIIPLIIDDFVTLKNINDNSINVQLLEEIFASISSKTYIFLDSMSTASELGLFANHSNNNKIHVMLPYKTDILEDRVGYFVSSIMLGQNKRRINLDYYRPKIKKIAIASSHTIEHYGFINDKLPNEIANKILNDSTLDKISKDIGISYSSEVPQNFAEFNLSIKVDNIDVRISTKTLFYIIVKLVYNKYIDKKFLKDKSINKVTEKFINEIYVDIRKTIALSISIKYFEKLYNYKDVNIITNLNNEIRIQIKHILKFIFLYHESEPRNGKMFINRFDKILLIKDGDLKENPYDLFKLNDDIVELIYKIRSNKDCYFEEFEINKNRKKRVLCRYKNNLDGEKSRALHDKLLDTIKNNINLSNYSYAYQNGKSIVSCVEQHLNSNYFLKFDIRNYFNSIDLNLLTSDLIKELDIDIIFKKHIETIINACTYNKKLPLGFTISPLLTEIYMKTFDNNVVSFLRNSEMVYTRYADDIMISSANMINEEEYERVYNGIVKLLLERKLKINKSKHQFIKINNVGQHVKYVGVNIIKGKSENSLSVGKKYRNDVAKEFLEYLELPSETDEQNMTRFYKSKVIAGKISFIRQVEGEYGYRKVIERIEKSTEGRLSIKTDNIMFEQYKD